MKVNKEYINIASYVYTWRIFKMRLFHLGDGVFHVGYPDKNLDYCVPTFNVVEIIKLVSFVENCDSICISIIIVVIVIIIFPLAYV